MDERVRCQSCGIPLADGFYGTEKNGCETQIFCKFCFQDGKYLQPELTVDDIIQMSVDNMTQDLEFSEEKARNTANSLIPQLTRWDNTKS